MAEKTTTPFFSVAIHPEYLALVSVRDSVVQEVGWRPFNPPLNAETLQNESLFRKGWKYVFLIVRAIVRRTDIAIAVNGSMVIQKNSRGTRTGRRTDPVSDGLGSGATPPVPAGQLRYDAQRLPFTTPSGILCSFRCLSANRSSRCSAVSPGTSD
jgi:hypothetical protein